MKAFIPKPTFPLLFYNLASIFLCVSIVLHCLGPARALGTAHRSGNETDHAALLAIKNQLVDHPGGVLSSWNNSVHHCSWEGVTCGRKHNRVIVLNLYSRGLGGTISPFIGNLSFLRSLALFNNSLVGHIPPELGRLSKLNALGLYNNTLEGEIPANLSGCVNLQRLSLASNKLGGRLPLQLRALSNLRILEIQGNSFTGPLFEVIANLTSLESINSAVNAFTGTIPFSIGKMQNLSRLFLGSNGFSGTIPTSLFNNSAIQILDLPSNNFEGEIPSDISLKLPQLIHLNLYSNRFSGAFPSSILNLTNLEVLGLEYNYFTGRITYGFGHLQRLWYLYLNANRLTGDINFILSTLVNCTKLENLGLAANEFNGTLPESVANLSASLRTFLLGYNTISGEIPEGITNLTSLEYLDLQENALTGSVPRDIGKLLNLEIIYLQQNSLTGSIPDTFGNLSLLSTLYLNDNQLTGSVPPSFGICQSLLDLNLSSNHLNGTLVNKLFNGVAKFVSVDLSNNLLEGSIPGEISKQTNLVEFSVSRNKLLGTIPNGLGDCIALVKFDIHGNSFLGNIPSSFNSLGSLQNVDLSQNNLSGTIPNYFSKFPLQLLNLSYNNFEGKVPTTGVFANMSAVALNGNMKLCGGISKLRLPRCLEIPPQRKKRRRLSHALKLIVPILCALVVLSIVTWLYLVCRKKKRSVPISSESTRKSLLKVSYDMLLKATDGFSPDNLVGVGSFGSVYRGVLDGRTIAIKVLNLEHKGASKSFMAECNTLRNVRHRNLLRIITACSSIDFQKNDFKALVYEFMPNGSLDRWLHGDGEEKLTLIQRVDIAINVAHALNYLHHDCEIPVVHCDLKPSNILLDNDMVARVGDFGLAKFLAQPRHPNQSSSIGIMGTVGYVAPEYGLGSESSQDGDLYSYGILVLELITGKRPTDGMFQDGYNLQKYAEAALPDNVLQIVDSGLEETEINEEVDNIRTIHDIAQRRIDCLVTVVGVGIECSNHLPQERLKISDAIRKLEVARELLCNARHWRNNIPRGA